METLVKHAPGSFCWPELATSDQAAAKKFYGALFGWTFQDAPMGPSEFYTTFKLSGRDCAALYALQPEMRKAGIPPHWETYVEVKSADDAAAKARQLGGTVMKEPFDVMEHGRMAVLKDPVGAMFCVWQAKKHAGVEVVSKPGALAWTQLNVKGPADPAKSFYKQMFGWWMKDDPIPEGGEYTTLSLDGYPIGGMMPMHAGAPKEMPSAWLTYFGSDNVDATVKKATGLGAKVNMEPTDIPDFGRIAVLADPQGAVFAVVDFDR